MKALTESNVRDLAKGDTITRTFVREEYLSGPDGSVSALPVLNVETYTVTGLRRYKDGRTRVAVQHDQAGYGATLAFPMETAANSRLEVAGR